MDEPRPPAPATLAVHAGSAPNAAIGARATPICLRRSRHDRVARECDEVE
jgi:hypothetical protein